MSRHTMTDTERRYLARLSTLKGHGSPQDWLDDAGQDVVEALRRTHDPADIVAEIMSLDEWRPTPARVREVAERFAPATEVRMGQLPPMLIDEATIRAMAKVGVSVGEDDWKWLATKGIRRTGT